MSDVKKRFSGRVRQVTRMHYIFGFICLVFVSSIIPVRSSQAALLNLPDYPLFVEGNTTALLQLVMQRDNNLFYEAYPSYEDINSDGVLDITFKPHEIDYYGYFDSNFCYISVNDRFEAVSETSDKKCVASWSGDFLNYMTMTRMDLLRAALYGGRRIVDSETETVLRRAFVPIENHTWGIEYLSLENNGYLISDYTPYSEPAADKRHFFATNNVYHTDVPYLRIRLNQEGRIWSWVSKERTQGDGDADEEYPVDVVVCDADFLEEFCQEYPNGHYKPVGLLHEYGESDQMYFGLISGSFENNLRGGVVRQNISSFGSNEVNLLNGTFTYTAGIVKSIDGMQIPNEWTRVGNAIAADCGWIADRRFVNGECRAWGNPIAEIMFEGMRYFSGAMDPTPEFFTDGGLDSELGLEAVAWEDPYAATQPYGQCAKAYQLVISDSSPSFDGDQLPGSDFSDFDSSTLGNMHVGDIADFISQHEPSLPGLKTIGQVGTIEDRSPTAKMVTSLRNIRGIAPDTPHREGSYYSSSVSYFGHTNDIHPTAPGEQTVDNFTLALGSLLPNIEVDVDGKKITFSPFGRTVEFCGQGHSFQPTNAIVGYDIESIGDNSGSILVSFEDMEQGGDNDVDTLVRYAYQVVDDKVEMNIEGVMSQGCGVQHLGFTVSGSEEDGVYLVVRSPATPAERDRDYELDVPPGERPGTNWNDSVALPRQSMFTFTPSIEPAAESLPSPLWYAAKWGGFNDINGDGIAQDMEWDLDGDNVPDNYIPVTNPAEMLTTLSNVFQTISDSAGSASAVTASTGSLRTGDKIYRSQFSSSSWNGDVFSQSIDANGIVSPTIDWSAKQQLNLQAQSGDREILTYNPESDRGVAFRWPLNQNSPADDELSLSQVAALRLNPVSNRRDARGEDRLDYIRGEPKDDFRVRTDVLGDIIHSSPTVVAGPGFFYPDNWGVDAPENAKPYSDFARQLRDRQRVTYVGANDGMLHAFDAGQSTDGVYDAGTGAELFAYIPSPVYPNLHELTHTRYTHKNFVDATPRAGDVFINGEWRTVLLGGLRGGGQGFYALDITEPDKISEDTAEEYVLWEFTDSHIGLIGYTFSTPVIARMANGRWAAIMANGYNNSARNVGLGRSRNGTMAIVIVDIETGTLTRAITAADASCRGNGATPNSPAEPTAIDRDGDNIVDTIYTGDLRGCVLSFDVSNPDPDQWERGVLEHKAIDNNDRVLPITTPIAVGSHPTGVGVMLFFGTGKYLEPSDQIPSSRVSRIYALWDRGDASSTSNLTRIDSGNMLEQSITGEEIRETDADNDGVTDGFSRIRLSTQEEIDWSQHEGWYIDLGFGSSQGEQVVAPPLLRDGRILFTTHVPSGDQCLPLQEGWFLVLDSRSGAMLPGGLIDLDGDSIQDDGVLSGVAGLVNPFAGPAILSADTSDIILSQSESNPELTATRLFTDFRDGRISWRELEP